MQRLKDESLPIQHKVNAHLKDENGNGCNQVDLLYFHRKLAVDIHVLFYTHKPVPPSLCDCSGPAPGYPP
ncbi:MAG: hypothetical protein RR544_04405, partial [Oscillospiraceae bacterium]